MMRRALALCLVLVMALSACAPKLPPQTPPDQRQALESHLLLRQIAASEEAIAKLLSAFSTAAEVATAAGKLSKENNYRAQQGGYDVTKTLRRRMQALREQIADPSRPLPTRLEIVRDLTEDVATVVTDISGIVCESSLVIATRSATTSEDGANGVIVPIQASTLSCDGVKATLLTFILAVQNTLTALQLSAPMSASDVVRE